MNKLIPSKPLFIMLFGMPGSGKTYFARQLAENIQAAHVQGDRIRTELFETPRNDRAENKIVAQLMDYMAQEFLAAGVSVVYDINAMRSAQRHAMREVARKLGARPVLIWQQIDIESAFVRNVKRDRRKTDDKFTFQMDRSTFDDVAAHMQNPAPAEDYIVISGKHTFKTQFNTVIKRLHELGLIDLNDAANRLAKPGMVNLVPSPAAGRVDMSRRNIAIR